MIHRDDVRCGDFICTPEKNPDHYVREDTDPPEQTSASPDSPEEAADIRVADLPVLDSTKRKIAEMVLASRKVGVGEVTVVENVYYQADEEDPWGVSDCHSYRVSEMEQAYVRHLKVGEGWVRLDPGWIRTCSTMLLRNDEGRGAGSPQSILEKRELLGRVVEVGIWTGEPAGPSDDVPINMHSPSGQVQVRPQTALIVPAGQSMRATPADLRHVYLRCRSGTARATLVLLPI